MSPNSAVLCLVAMTVLGPRALAQPGSPVYPDDSPAAAAGLVAVDRLLASGNTDEAVRTLQGLLADEGERVVAVIDDEDLFVGVRGAVHDRLLARPELLARYREVYSPQAQLLLDTGRLEDLERVYLLTPAGLEAALRLAQQRLESARFNAAMITLIQLEAHPDRVGEAGRGAAGLAAQLARYLPRREVVELATRWSADTGALDLEPYERPVKADRKTFTPMTTGEALDGDAIPPTPMWTVPLESDDSIRVRRPSRRTVRERRPGLWTHPTIAGQILLVNDTVWIRAWDRYTLEPLWRVKPGVDGPGSAQLLGEAWEQRTSDTIGHIQIEDSSSVSVWGSVVVAVTGFAKDGLRFGDGRVHGLDLRTGATRWSVSPGAGDEPLDRGTARGPVLVDEGMAVVAIRRSARTRRVVSFLLMGIDALSGEVRWVRPIGSAGALPFANDRRVSNAPVLDRGVVFASDQIGVIAAVEAETGRSIWVRRLGAAQMAARARTSAWESIAAVVHGDAVYMLTPARDRIVMLDRHTGRLIASRTADRFGLVQYLVGAGEYLAAVGETKVATVRFDEFQSGPIRLTRRFDQPGIRGRVVPAGGHLYVPTLEGLVQIDPADPRDSMRFIALDHPGEALPVGEQVVVVDDVAVHTYVSWTVADRVLLERMRAEPDLAAPAVSYADLAYRVGRADRIVPAVDRALEALARRPSDASNIAARSRLFKTLHTMATDTLTSTPVGGEAPVLDAVTLRMVVDRLGRVAATSEQRVEYLLVLGPALESGGEHSAASEAYGRVLADSALSDVELVSDGRRDEARSVATRRLRALVLEHGVEAYAGENTRAAAALEKLGSRADPAALEALARRYPVSVSAARAWLGAGEADLNEGRAGESLLAFRRSLLAAEVALAAGLSDDTSAVAASADRIVTTLRDRGRYAEAAQVLARLMAEYPDSPMLAALSDAGAVLRDLKVRAAASDRRPRIGSTLTGAAQAIPGWTLVPTLMDSREGGVGHVLLRSTAAREIALFGPVEAVRGLGERAMHADGPGRLARLWSRTFTDFAPGVIRVDDDSVYLLWPTPRGGDIERISVIDGRTLWRTGAFDSLFQPDASFVNRLTNRLRLPIMFDTPSGVRRAAAELVVWVGPDAVVMVERSGRMAVFDPATGAVVRTTITPVAAVFDVHVADELVALAGSKSPPNPDTGRLDLDPIVAVFDARTGERIETSAVVSAPPAWVRVADPSTLVVGGADGLICFDIATGGTRWSHLGDVPGAATDGTMAAWVFGPVLYTLGRSGQIVARSMTDGRVIGNRPLVGNGRFGRRDIRTVRAGDRTVFVGGAGVVVTDVGGTIVGMDPLDSMRRAGILRPAIADERIVAVERAATVDAQGRGVNRVHMLSSRTGELLGSRDIAMTEPPSRIAVLDGRVLISTASMTIVYDTSEN